MRTVAAAGGCVAAILAIAQTALVIAILVFALRWLMHHA